MPLYWVTSALSQSVTAAFDAIELVEPGTGFLFVRRILLWQTSDLGDAQEEILRVEWMRGHDTSGSGGVQQWVSALNSYDIASSFTAELLNTSVATEGSPSAQRLYVGGWNIRIPLDLLFPPGEYICARNGERLVFRVSAPADAITVNCACLVEQI